MYPGEAGGARHAGGGIPEQESAQSHLASLDEARQRSGAQGYDHWCQSPMS
jgi:hypothetical protein